MSSTTPTYNRLVSNLRRFHQKEKTVEAFSNVLRFLSFALPLVFLFVLLESIFQLSSTGRLILLVLMGLGLFVIAILFLGRTVRSLSSMLRPNMLAVANKVGGFYKDVDDRLINALQLYENYERDKERFSVDLVEASISNVGHVLEREDFSAHVDVTSLRLASRNFSILFFVLLLPLVFFNPLLSTGFNRLVHPSQDFSEFVKIDFFVSPGNAQIIKGEDIRLRAWVSDSSAQSVSLVMNNQADKTNVTLTKAANDSFEYTIENVRDTLSYYFALKNINSEVYSIFPLERPLLRTLEVHVTPPAYAKIDAYFLDENVGDIHALKGSKIKLSGLANKNLKSGNIRFEKSETGQLNVQGRRIASDFTVWRDDNYSIHLVDENDNKNIAPITYTIQVIPDNYPIVRIVSPGKDIDLGDDMTIPLAIEAEDDFGISQLRLGYQLIPNGEGDVDSSQFAYSPISGFDAGENELRVLLNWDLSSVDMFPTDVLLYFVDVFDNDNMSGPKRSRSDMYRARFPSLYEMYEDVADEQDDVTNAFEETLEKSRELQQKLDQLSLDMQRSEMDWQQKQEVEEALKQQREIEQQLEKVTEQLDEMIENIEKNNLFTPETLQKFEEIQQLYNEIMTPELQDLMQQMNEAMENVDEQMIKKAMEEMKLNAEEYNETLDRTIALLKKLQAEQKLDQAQKMAEDLAQRQDDMTQATEQQTADNERLQKEQERINKDAEKLAELMQELQQDSKEIPAMPEQPINEAAQEMQNQNLQQNLQDLQQMLAQNQMANAPQKSSQSQQSFQKMSQSLQQAQQMMSGELQQQAMQAMRKSSRELLQLSKQQEQLMRQTQPMSRTNTNFPQAADQQQKMASALKRVVDDMSQAMKDNFGIDPKVSQSLGQAMQQMDNALQQMESRDGRTAAQSQGQSMAQMNSAIRQMQQSMQNMQSQGSSGGMSYQQFMQQMQQMGDAQGQINQQTQGMQPGGMSLGQQAAMARLAAQQRQVRKSMEQLATEAGGMSEVLGSLDNIADDMKKVEQDFANKQITRDTINRQNRILSRMLDAQKSVNQREFSRERKAETGKSYTTTSPDALPDDLGERNNQLQQDLLRAKKEGYSRDYLQLIEDYFKALTEQDGSQNQ
jgi:hypothetical protein